MKPRAILSLSLALTALAVLVVQTWELCRFFFHLCRGFLVCVMPTFFVEKLLYGLAAFYLALPVRRFLRQSSFWPPLVTGAAAFFGSLFLLGRGLPIWLALAIVAAHLLMVLWVICHDVPSFMRHIDPPHTNEAA